MNTLKIYRPVNEQDDIINRAKQLMYLQYYASDIMEWLGLADTSELIKAVCRAQNACSSLHVSVEENFSRVYRSYKNMLQIDWKLSPLASYLLIVNCDPANPFVAKAQLFHFKNS